jgi:OOP family OmpA-OmpF porin
MKKTVIALSAAVALFAGDAAYQYEITPTIGGVLPEGNLDLDDQLSYGLRLGRNVDNLFFDQIELGVEHAPNVDVENTNLDTDITRYFANIIKEYDVAAKTKLYALVGLGYEHLSDEYADNDSAMFANYGVGVKQQILDKLWLKADVRHAIKFDDGDNNLLYTVGLAIPFGPTAAKTAPAEPVTYVPVKPVPAPAPAPDFDKDGVPNGYDKCPNTPLGAKVDRYGCEVDSDNDGVVDRLDACPGTPEGIKVDKEGCAQTITLRVMFDFDKATIKPEYMHKIKEVAIFLETHPQFNVKLEGHTDSKGGEVYNQKLSQARALAVGKALVDLGVEEPRVRAEGFGESRPVATNDTEEGRALNRRVEAKFRK